MHALPRSQQDVGPFLSGAFAPTLNADLTSSPLPRSPCPALPLQYLGDVPLGPNDETTAEYGIMFPRQLPPREFVLKVGGWVGGPMTTDW